MIFSVSNCVALQLPPIVCPTFVISDDCSKFLLGTVLYLMQPAAPRIARVVSQMRMVLLVFSFSRVALSRSMSIGWLRLVTVLFGTHGRTCAVVLLCFR